MVKNIIISFAVINNTNQELIALKSEFLNLIMSVKDKMIIVVILPTCLEHLSM